MGLIGFILSIVAGGFLTISVLPLLGWINWFTTLPLAVAGAALSALSLTRRGHLRFLGILGLIIGILVFFGGINRLIIGCGLF